MLKENSDSNWKLAFYTTLISVSLIYLFTIYLISDRIFSFEKTNIFYKQLAIERTVPTLNRIMDYLNDQKVKFTDDQIQSLLNEERAKGNTVDIDNPSRFRRITLDNIEMEIDKDNVLTRIRISPLYFPLSDTLYNPEPSKSFFKVGKSLFSKSFYYSRDLLNAFLIFIVFVVGLVFQIIFEFKSKKIKIASWSFIFYFLGIILIVFFLVMRFFADGSELSDFLFHSRYVNANMIMEGFNIRLQYPLLLMNLFIVISLFISVLYYRVFKFIGKNGG